MNSYVGEPHVVLARIHHEELLARAEEARRLDELRRLAGSPRGDGTALRVLRRLRWLAARRPDERRPAPRLAR